MSGVYGPVHLLRLFVKLPALLAATTLDSDAMSTLQSRLLELVKFMASRQEEYFQASAYKFAPQPYVASFNKHSRKLGVPTTASGDAPGVSQPPAQLLAASLDKDALAKERAIAAASASASSSSSSSSSSADEKGASVAPTAVAAS